MRAGRVTVNGRTVREPGAKADPERDDIRVDGKPIPRHTPHLYLLLNKPVGYVTTTRDPHAERTVMDLLRNVPGRIYPVGRLDADTAGLLLLTNDGDFANRILHPSHGIRRTYRAVVQGLVEQYALTDLRMGVALQDGMARADGVTLIERNAARRVSVVDVTISEGRKREVRRMFEAVGHRVLALTRTRFGPLTLRGLAPGTWRKLRPVEVAALLSEASGGDEAPGHG